jgi:trehalose 6-phosphate phosphatase
MHYLFSTRSKLALERLARERTLCAFDFDGTLAPITGHPDQAAMRPRTRELLAKLADLYPCVIITGRTRKDVLTRLEGIAVREVIGSHGAEASLPQSPVAPRLPDRLPLWKAIIERGLALHPEIWVEDKGFSLAIHYRQFPRKAEARRLVQSITSSLEGAQVFGGKEVVNVMEAGAATKGVALAAERERLNCNWALYVGDDENDEDAFSLEGNLVPVRVGLKVRSGARYYLRSQREIDDLLATLVRLRNGPEPGLGSLP